MQLLCPATSPMLQAHASPRAPHQTETLAKLCWGRLVWLTATNGLLWPAGSSLQGRQVATAVCWVLQPSVQGMTSGEWEKTVHNHGQQGRLLHCMKGEAFDGCTAEAFRKKSHKYEYQCKVPVGQTARQVPMPSRGCLRSPGSWSMRYKHYTSPLHTPQEGQAPLRAALPPCSHPAYIHQCPDFWLLVWPWAPHLPSPPWPSLLPGGGWQGRPANGAATKAGFGTAWGSRSPAENGSCWGVHGAKQLCSSGTMLVSKPEG